MKFSNFKANLKNIAAAPLGGLQTQLLLAPKIRKKSIQKALKNANPKNAAVLVLFFPDAKGETHFLLTLRARYKGTHSAQISFPGGKFMPSDNSLNNTALRETYEETGLAVEDISIFKKMTDLYIPPSNFMVSPFLGIVPFKPEWKINHEVEKTLEIPLKNLLDDKLQTSTVLSTSYAEEMKVPCYDFSGFQVWGATAMMLSEIKALFK